MGENSLNLKIVWADICNDYLERFCERHEYHYDPSDWVADDPGTIIEIADMFVSMDDIRYDVDNDVNPDLFDKWYWESVDRHEKGLKYMNYPSFVKGAPDPYTPEQLKQINALIEEARAAKKNAMQAIEAAGGKPQDCVFLM